MFRFPSLCAAFLAVALLVPFVHASEPADLNKTSQKNTDSRSNDPVVKAVKKAMPSVVAIRVPRQGQKDSIGAGVIVHKSGLIITNRHVTCGKRYIKVRLNDGDDLAGEVIVTDSDLDLAIVRITSEKPLQPLSLGADDMFLAEKVIAVGSPYGYEGTVSLGIISALNREITMPNDVVMTGLIQHDAPINPGNSGGPLLNINAEVIGINVAMRDGAQNIAFAINSKIVGRFLTKHMSAKLISGVEHGLKCEEKIVAEVGDRQRMIVKNAAYGELKSGDEIVTVGNSKVANTFEVESAFWNTKPGQKVEVKVLRQNRPVTVTLTLAASQGAGQVASVSLQTPATNSPSAIENVRTANER